MPVGRAPGKARRGVQLTRVKSGADRRAGLRQFVTPGVCRRGLDCPRLSWNPGMTVHSTFVAVAAALAPAAVAAADDSRIEAEIVVTAPRTQGPLEVVTDPRRPRQPLPAHDGADYLKTIPGFSVIRKGGTDGDPLFRGMAGSRVAIVSDEALLLGGCGMRMDPPTAYVFPQNYDRIRVLKGPQSVLWGAGGSAATVLFERDPLEPGADASRLDASVLTGSWGRRDLALDAMAGNDLGYLRLQGSDARADDYESGSGEDVHSEYHRWNANLMVGFRPADDVLVELSAARSDGKAAYADRMMDGSAFDREAFSLRVRWDDIGPMLRDIDAQIAYGYVDHVMDNYSLRDFTPTMMMPNPTVSNPDRETLAARFAASLAFTSELDSTLGIDAHRDEHGIRSAMNQLMMPYQAQPRMTDARFDQLGLFGEFTWRPAEGRSWAWGARVDRWEVEDERETVRPGMMGRVPNDTAGATDTDWLTSAFLRYEHGLRKPAGSDAADVVLFAGLGHSARIADYWERFGNDKQSVSSNSAFFTDPERTTQLDVGVLRRTDNGSLSVSLFASSIDDYVLIDARPVDEPMGTIVTRSVDARTWGGEVEFVRALGDAWNVQGSLAYTRGTNTTDDVALAQMPPLESRLALNYVRERLAVGALLRLVADQDRIDPGRGNIVGQDISGTDSFAVFSVNGSYRFSSAVRVSAGVDNLFDEAYAEHLSRAGSMVTGFVQTDRIDEPGRTLWLKLDVSL